MHRLFGFSPCMAGQKITDLFSKEEDVALADVLDIDMMVKELKNKNQHLVD